MAWWRKGKKRGNDGPQHPQSDKRGGYSQDSKGGITGSKKSDRKNGGKKK